MQHTFDLWFTSLLSIINWVLPIWRPWLQILGSKTIGSSIQSSFEIRVLNWNFLKKQNWMIKNLTTNFFLPGQKNPKGTYNKKYTTIKIKFRQDRSQSVGSRPFIFDSLNWTSWNVLISSLFELVNKTETTFTKCVPNAFCGQISTCNKTPFVRKSFYNLYFL